LIDHLIGESNSQKVIDECLGIYREHFKKQYPNYFENNFTKSMAILTIQDPNSNEIKNISMSKINDLLLDNWGVFIGSLITNRDFSLLDESGVSKTYENNSIGSLKQVMELLDLWLELEMERLQQQEPILLWITIEFL